MSDLGRKDFSQQAKEKVTPDSQKSTFEQTKEGVTGLGDRATSAIQPEGDKSATQKVGDSVRGTSDDASNQSKGLLDSASEGLSSATQSIQDTFSGSKK